MSGFPDTDQTLSCSLLAPYVNCSCCYFVFISVTNIYNKGL